MSAISALVVGAGDRGRHVYGRWARDHPEALRIVAVVEPDRARRDALASEHHIAPGRRHSRLSTVDTRDIDAVIVASPDRSHHAAATWAMDAGVHTLLEKPMAASLEETVDIVGRAARSKGTVHVGHVLRYTPFFRTVHGILESGAIGDVVSVDHRENVAAFHMAHSFVRGNWSRSDDSTPMIVQKCCHDFDILVWNLEDPVTRLTSTGSLLHFTPDHAPAGATSRCTDGCPVDDCPFDARRVYLDERITAWPVHVVTDDLSRRGRLAALTAGPYGRCVYGAGSTVVDHQVVSMELGSGATATLTMQGHSHREERTMRYDGTRGTLRAATGNGQITLADHVTGRERTVPVPASEGGHGGGDDGIIRSFVRSVHSGEPGPTDASTALESHRLAFLAELARVEGRWISVERGDP